MHLKVGESGLPPSEKGVGRRGAGPAGDEHLHGLGHELLCVVLALDHKDLVAQDPGNPVNGALIMAEIDGRSVRHHGDHHLGDIQGLELVRHSSGQDTVKNSSCCFI